MSPTPSVELTSSPKPKKPLIRRVRSGIHSFVKHNHENCHKDYCDHNERQRRTSSSFSSSHHITTSPPGSPPETDKTYPTLVLPPSHHKSESSFSSTGSTQDSSKSIKSWLDTQSIDYSVPEINESELSPDSKPPSLTPNRTALPSFAEVIHAPQQHQPLNTISIPPPGLPKSELQVFPAFSTGADDDTAGLQPLLPERPRRFSEMGVGTNEDLDLNLPPAKHLAIPEILELPKEQERAEKEEATQEDLSSTPPADEKALEIRRALIQHGTFCVYGFVFVRTFIYLFG